MASSCDITHLSFDYIHVVKWHTYRHNPIQGERERERLKKENNKNEGNFEENIFQIQTKHFCKQRNIYKSGTFSVVS